MKRTQEKIVGDRDQTAPYDDLENEEVRRLERVLSELERKLSRKQDYVFDLERQVEEGSQYVSSLLHEIQTLKHRLEVVERSYSFRIVRTLLYPFTWLQKILGRKHMIVWSSILESFTLAPLSTLRFVSLQNFRRLSHALNTEEPGHIARNIKRAILRSKNGDHAFVPRDPEARTTALEGPRIKNLKNLFVQQKRRELEVFLDSGSTLRCTTSTTPTISILLVLYNRAELTLSCLQSIIAHCKVPYELMIIDNASSDPTSELLASVEGARIFRNDENLGFLKACNQGFNYARGKYVLLLNNDARILQGSIEAAYRTLLSDHTIGAVGGKIVLLDGSLQEAGSIIWNDGSCAGYGRGEDPDDPKFMFRREVDFCSGAFLLTPLEIVHQLNGFDEGYSPAYYEETDFCMRLREHGYKVMYEPRAEIIHFEFASSENSDRAIQLQRTNRIKFVDRHRERLSKQMSPQPKHHLPASQRRSAATLRILYIDDMIPHTDRGAGFPRSNEIVNQIDELGHFVTLLPLNFPAKEGWDRTYQDINPTIECAFEIGREALLEFLDTRISFYDTLWISRPHNMEFLASMLPHIRRQNPEIKIIYDSEAVYAHRDLIYAKLHKTTDTYEEIEQKMEEELSMGHLADFVITVNSYEADLFKQAGVRDVSILDTRFDIAPSAAGFEERAGLLFVGNLDQDESPNVDSILWFVEKVYPLLSDKFYGLPLTLIGSNRSDVIQKLARQHHFISLTGQVDRLDPYFESHRVFIAPTRFAAGSPAKVILAASQGLPVVASSMIVEQSEMQADISIIDGGENNPATFASAIEDLMIDKQKWQSIREQALLSVAKKGDESHKISVINHVLSRDLIDH